MDKNVQIYKDKENPKEEINHSYANGLSLKKKKVTKKKNPTKTSPQLLPLALVRSWGKLLIPTQKIQINTSVHKWTITTGTRSIR